VHVRCTVNRADPVTPFESLAAALAEWPSLTRRLLMQHPATGGVCPACSTPGGRIVVESPCPPRALAERARKIHAQRGGQ
jgi:hypothetical protein